MCGFILRALALAISIFSPWALAAPNELLLDIRVSGARPVPGLVYELEGKLYIPADAAQDIGLPNAESFEVEGIPVPVIKGIRVTQADESVDVVAPAEYFSHTRVRLSVETAAAQLPTVNSMWVNYDLHWQKATGLRQVGGGFNVFGSLGTWDLQSRFRLNRETQYQPFSRIASFASKVINDHVFTVGDLASNTNMPVTTRRDMLGVGIASFRALGEVTKPPVIRGAVNTAGRLQVLRNNTKIANYALPPGTFDVVDLPDVAGVGKYELLFDDGKSVKLMGDLMLGRPTKMLRKGQYTYSLQTGVRQDERSANKGSPQYTGNYVFDGNVTYGLSDYVNLYGYSYATRGEQWVGGVILSDWHELFSSELALASVKGERTSGVMAKAMGRFNYKGVSAQLSTMHFSDPRGTPVEGFVGEQKLNLSYDTFGVYAVKNTAFGVMGVTEFKSTGVSYSKSLGVMNLSVYAGRSQLTGADKTSTAVGVYVSIPLGSKSTVYGGGTADKQSIGARYSENSAWNIAAELSQDRMGVSKIMSGSMDTRQGTAYGVVAQAGEGSVQPLVGFNGSFALAQTQKGLSFTGYKGSEGDSLLLVDVGAPNATLVVDHSRKVTTGSNGVAFIPISSRQAHKVNLDVASLELDVTVLNTAHRVKVSPRKVGYLAYNLQNVGFGVTLKDIKGRLIEEGSIAVGLNFTSLVGSKGFLWLEKPLSTVVVQVGRNKFCVVKEIGAEGEYTCTPYKRKAVGPPGTRR